MMEWERSEGASAATIWEVLRLAGRELERAGVESPGLTAELLMAHTLGWTRTRVLGHIHDPLPTQALKGFHHLVQRRASGEPLQYLTGAREFYGLSFRVTPAVLIPRPETEILVEKAVALARSRETPVRFVDVGTGSGCIAVSVAHEVSDARGWATDLSPAALAVARENAARLEVGGHVEFICCDLMECFPARPAFDLILSNPPYVPGPETGDLPRMIRDYEPHLALCGGDEGLAAYRRLIPQAAPRLAPDGFLLMEVGAGQASAVAGLVAHENLALIEIIEDMQMIPRCIVAQRRTPRELE